MVVQVRVLQHHHRVFPRLVASHVLLNYQRLAHFSAGDELVHQSDPLGALPVSLNHGRSIVLLVHLPRHREMVKVAAPRPLNPRDCAHDPSILDSPGD